MNETILTWLVFILAFASLVLIHEFGHYIVARWSKVEVEEFGIGLPTPGAITLWTNKGHMMLDDGGRVEIPFNFKVPFHWNEFLDRQVKITVDRVDDRLVMRSIEAVQSQDPGQRLSRRVLKAGKGRGQFELLDVVTEVHPGTRFTLNWLPLGGFVRPKGENDPSVPGGLAAASPWHRLAVLVAGPLMNLLAAALIYSIIFGRVGVPDATRVLVASVVPGSPAAQAGFESGDIFISGNGQPIHTYDDLREIVDANANKPVSFLVDRTGEQIELLTIPQMNPDEQRVMIGVGLGTPFRKPSSPVETLTLGARYTAMNIRAVLALPAQLIRGSLDSEQGRLIGLKGIFDVLQQTVSRDVEASAAPPSPAASNDPMNQPVLTLQLIASLSISLGLFNLFPFPALDGGRILFVLPELLFRKRVSPQVENLVHGMGMAFLLLLMIYINVMDFVDPITVTIP